MVVFKLQGWSSFATGATKFASAASEKVGAAVFLFFFFWFFVFAICLFVFVIVMYSASFYQCLVYGCELVTNVTLFLCFLQALFALSAVV